MPSTSDFEHVYSPETDGIASGERQLAIARNEFAQQMIAVRNQVAQQQAAVDAQKRELATARARVREEEAENWRALTMVRSQRADLENEAAVVKRDKELIAKQEAQLRALEDTRRRNRTVSAAFIEDTFASLSPRAVVENLTNSSLKIRKHAMDNISACIAGFRDPPPTFARFTPRDIAPDLLPKLHQLVSSPGKPLNSVLDFAENVVSAPPMASALARSGQCSRLSDFLIEDNEFTSELAIRALRCMVGMETTIVKPAYEAMSLVIPHIPLRSPDRPPHPSIDFIVEVAPKIIEDCFSNGLWLAVSPLVCHHIPAIRKVALRKIVLLAQHSDRTRHGLVESHALGFLDMYYHTPSPPADVLDFFTELLPLVADKMCRSTSRIQWLLIRLGDPSAAINAAVISAFRACLLKQDPAALQVFVGVDLIRRLNEPPTQQSYAITKLICQMLPILAIPYAQARVVESIVAFLDHGDAAIADASLAACVKVMGSTLPDRSHLYLVASKLNFAKESTLKLFDHAIPVFCRDWAASGELNMIVPFLQHSELRLRHSAQQVWGELVATSPAARSKIVHDGLLDTIFELCHSQYEDAVMLGAKCCSPMSLEITKAGVTATRQLVELLNHPSPLIRQASLRGIQIACEASDQGCKVLLDADVFKALNTFLETYPKDLLDNARKILSRLTPLLNTSPEACTGLLGLLESTSPAVERSAHMALMTISNMSVDQRATLRGVVLNRLQLPTEPLVEFSIKAIQDWIGPDLAFLNDFETLFGLASHSDRRIQTSTLISLRQKLSILEYQESLEKANIVFVLRSLSNSDNPEAFNFVAGALRMLALTLARNGHARVIIDLLGHDEVKVREGATTALEIISSSTMQARKALLSEDIIETLSGHEERLEQPQLQVLSSIIPNLAIDYVEAGKIDILLTLVDHAQQQIRIAASKSVTMIAGGTTAQRGLLREALLPRLDQASASLREVAASCLSRTIAQDLIGDGDFIQAFRIIHSDDARVRSPILQQLRTFIQGSDEAARRRLVDAGILPAVLQVYTPIKDDLLTFLVDCALPMLGPSFTANDGGSTLFPLLEHSDTRLRNAGVQSLRNAIESRHGNLDNLAKSSVIGILYPLISRDEAVRDLWCRMLPKISPFLVHHADIDILFECLSNNRTSVREAAHEGLSIMAKTSEATRNYLFPSILQHMENPMSTSLGLISLAVSLSGSIFVQNGKETELLYHILHGVPDIAEAAVEATSQLLAKGSSFELQQLMKADVFIVALKLHDRQTQRLHSLKLLLAIISHLSHAILLDEELAREMFSLFDDPDANISAALYNTWSSDARVYESGNLPELIPLLLEHDRLRNPSVIALLRQLATFVIPKLVARRRLDVVVQALMANETNVVQAFLQEVRQFIEASNDSERDWFVSEPSLVSSVGIRLKGHNATMRRDASIIIQLLSKGSASRAGRIMNEGIGQHLSEVAVNGEKGAQQSSLRALLSLYIAAPDHSERLVRDCLPALQDLLYRDDLTLGVSVEALRFLAEIVQQSSHSPIIQSGIIVDLVRWLSPRHSVTDLQCRELICQICEAISQQSDAGRKALIEAKVLQELSCLATSRLGIEVIGACRILKALAHSGTFANDIDSAGLKKIMKKITSPLHKSTLQSKEEKFLAQAAAKEAIQTLETVKRRIASKSSPLTSQTIQRKLHRSHSNARFSMFQEDVDEDGRHGLHNQHLRRTASDSVVASDLEYEVAGEDVFERSRNLRHMRSLSESQQRTPATGTIRRRPISVAYEARQQPSMAPLGITVEEDELANVDEDIGFGQRPDTRLEQPLSEPNSHQNRLSSLRRRDDFNAPSIESPPSREDYPAFATTSLAAPNRSEPQTSRTGTRRRFNDVGEDSLLSTASGTGGSRTSPPTYRSMSVSGSMRRK